MSTDGNLFEHDPEGHGIEALFSEYVDRLNAGEILDHEEIRVLHPDVADELFERLEEFEGLFGDTHTTAPLGTLGDYTLKRQIGRGGMGVVYEAWQGSMDRVVALKVLPPAVAADDRAYGRFMQEARAAGKLGHPNVVAVHASGQDEQTPYYAMEFVEGETLAEILARIKDAEPETETAFGEKDSIVYFGKLAQAFADVADGLQHAHAKGVTHRDIKPSNLILDREGRLRILDFGLARLEGQESLTLSGDLVGTPLYMSPEQARRRKIPVDHRTDIYSLGATIYEAITGRPPFRGKDHADTLTQIIERDPVEPRKRNPRVPKDLETIVLKCLRKNAGDRYGTAEALGQDLGRFVRGDAIEARDEPRWQRALRKVSRRRKALTIAALVLVSLTSTTLIVVSESRAFRARREADFEARLERAALDLSLAEAGVLGVSARPGSGYLEAAFLLDDLRGIGALWEPPGARARAELDRLAREFPERAAVLADPLAGSTPAAVVPDVRRWVVGGLDHLRAGREMEALEHFVAARLRWPRHPQPSLLIGKTYLLLGRPEDAERAHRRLLDVTPAAERDSVIFWIVSQHAMLGAYESARAWAEEIARPGPRHYLTGISHSFSGDYSAAAEHLEEARGSLPESAVLLRSLAGSLWFRDYGDWSRAALERMDALLRRAVERDSLDLHARCLRTEVLLALGDRVEELERLLEESLELAGDDPIVCMCYGWARYRQGDLDAGEKFLTRALEADPPHRAMVATSLGVVLKRKGENERALALFDESIKLDSRHAWARQHRAEILLRLGRAREAAEEARRAVDLPPVNSARSLLIRALLELGEIDEASRQARLLTDVDSPKPGHLALLGRTLLAAGRRAEAERAFRRAAEHPDAGAGLEREIEKWLAPSGGPPDG